MKGIAPVIPALIIMALIGVPGVPATYDAVGGEGTHPDSALYGLEKAGEAVRKALSFDKEDRALLRAEIALERVRELDAMSRRNRTEFMSRLLQEYHDEMDQAERDIVSDDRPVRVTTFNEMREGQARALAALEQVKARLTNQQAIQAIEMAQAIIEARDEQNSNGIVQAIRDQLADDAAVCTSRGGTMYDGVTTCAPCPEGMVCIQACRAGCFIRTAKEPVEVVFPPVVERAAARIVPDVVIGPTGTGYGRYP